MYTIDCYLYFCIFFVFKQKTAYEMRISDWSSDVCSSDLPHRDRAACPTRGRRTSRQGNIARASGAGEASVALLLLDVAPKPFARVRSFAGGERGYEVFGRERAVRPRRHPANSTGV